MSTARLRSLAIACIAAWLISSGMACQSTVGGLPDAGTPIAVDDARVQQRFAELRANAAQRSALRGSAKLSLDSPEIRFSRPQRLVLQAPASLRIEVLGLFDQVAGVVATDGEHFGFVDLVSGRREGGAVDDGLLWRTARVDLTPREAVSLLLGFPPLESDARVVSAVRFGGGGFGARVGSASRDYWLEWDEAGGLRRAELKFPSTAAGAGAVRWDVRFGDRRLVDGVSFAHSIDLVFPRVDAKVSFEYDAVELEPALSPSIFVLQVAAGE